jgi:hypothetical protein
MRGAISHLPNTPHWHGAQLKKAQGQLYFTFKFIGVGQHIQILNRLCTGQDGHAAALQTQTHTQPSNVDKQSDTTLPKYAHSLSSDGCAIMNWH